MKFGYIGIDYKHADQDIRDRVSFTDNQKIDFLQKAGKAGIEQCFVLSTCNRSEVYFFAPEEIAQPLGVIRTLYEEMFPGVDFSEYLKQREEMDAISYLFRVTAGLESMVLGEDQILGQVRDAFELSRTVGSTGKETPVTGSIAQRYRERVKPSGTGCGHLCKKDKDKVKNQ